MRRLPRSLRVAALLVLVAVFALAVSAYRKHQQRLIVAISMARAEHLVRSDTWLGYHEAAALLGVRASALDPVHAGSLRALALAMLSLDYRDDDAATHARAALERLDGRDEMPPDAHLAAAALALRDGQAGTALERLGRAGDLAPAQVLTARVALLAGNTAAAFESAGHALERDPRSPAALALRADLLRRAGRTTEARDAYAAALKESNEALEAGSPDSLAAGVAAPHPRSAFGLAKLALSRDGSASEATAALAKLMESEDATPRVERTRGAMYLAALQRRLGDPSSAGATMLAAPVEGDLRSWIEKSAAQLESATGRYRVPAGTPAALTSASDDDPYVPPPPPPAARAEAPPPRPKLFGFKVHPEPKRPKATKNGPARRKSAISAPTKKRTTGTTKKKRPVTRRSLEAER